MISVSSLAELETYSFDHVSIACGNFDGLHRGHQEILKKLLEVSAASNSTPVILTFSPHPREVLQGIKVENLSSPTSKNQFLTDLGIKALVTVPFTLEFANNDPESFLRKILLATKLKVVNLCVGKNWRFGKNRSGDVHLLQQNKWQWQVHSVDEMTDELGVISSSRIRKALLENDFQLAEKLLGRPYSVIGKVVKGRGLATSTLHFPTANIEIDNLYLPLSGVYTCLVNLANDEKIYYGLANIGTTPTFNDLNNPKISLEVHILNFSSDLYGQNLEIIFKSFLRSEKKFESPLKLKEQIQQDVITTRKLFNIF